MRLPQFASAFFNSVSNFGWYLLKSSVLEDDKTPIRSGDGVVFQPLSISNLAFSIDHIKEIKSKLGVTMNDVIVGIIFYALRLYMQDLDHASKEARSTALVVLNRRNVEGYQSVQNMLSKDAKSAWGNRASSLHVSLPKLKDAMISNPLLFVLKAHKIIHRKRKSFAVLLTDLLMQMLYKIGGHEAVAKQFCRTVRKSSLVFSSMVGPVEQIAMSNHPVKGLYYFVIGGPMDLVVTMMRYMGVLRITFKMDKGFLIEQKLKSCVVDAFDKILKAARDMPISCSKDSQEVDFQTPKC
ncbi:hypothetical protein L6164_033195 [Bauhinia variegata]|uniref:Uncharacterized protein n=1 Tax=Bauhinia variegata TaxID=167791 RepID=A0ACB9KR54_BAUVA|nr:hypothetical protein L6164_033195 [Bauhinia variegata]